MPLRPELPPGLGLPRRTDAPMRLPRLHFPMVGGAPEQAGGPVEEMAESPEMEMPSMKPEEGIAMMEMMRPMTPAPAPAPSSGPVLTARDCTRVIVYGQAGCPACLGAIQDLIDRQVCFTYHDVSRDEKAMLQLQAICGAEAVVPVIIQVGVRGG